MPAPYGVETPPYTAVSDVAGPYVGMPPEAPPRYEPGYGRYEPGYGPGAPGYGLMPPRKFTRSCATAGFRRSASRTSAVCFYTISVIDRRGDDGRLVIDARNGRIIRFMPAYRMGDNFNDEPPAVIYGPPGRPLPPMPPLSGLRERPPAPVPRMASRTPAVPLPKAPPPHAVEVRPELKPEIKPDPRLTAAKPAAEPSQQSAAVQSAPADVPLKPPPAVPIVTPKPAPELQPTQPMPKAQGLD